MEPESSKSCHSNSVSLPSDIELNRTWSKNRFCEFRRIIHGYGSKRKPLGTTGFSLFFLLPIGSLGTLFWPIATYTYCSNLDLWSELPTFQPSRGPGPDFGAASAATGRRLRLLECWFWDVLSCWNVPTKTQWVQGKMKQNLRFARVPQCDSGSLWDQRDILLRTGPRVTIVRNWLTPRHRGMRRDGFGACPMLVAVDSAWIAPDRWGLGHKLGSLCLVWF